MFQKFSNLSSFGSMMEKNRKRKTVERIRQKAETEKKDSHNQPELQL